MIARDLGAAWQLVLQPDHADLCGAFAEAWGNERFDAPRPLRSLACAAARHDDGWAVWERAPGIVEESRGLRPQTFTEFRAASHVAFYRAAIAAVGEEDPYAGLLVSLHGVGLYNGRFGFNPPARFPPEAQAQVAAFVAEQEAAQRALVARLGVDEPELWVNYRLLQAFDRLSLHFCMRDLERGEPALLPRVPVDYGGGDVELRVEPDGPRSVRLDPFPFRSDPAEFVLVRRRLPKRAWRDVDDFRADFRAAAPEAVRLVARAA